MDTIGSVAAGASPHCLCVIDVQRGLLEGEESRRYYGGELYGGMAFAEQGMKLMAEWRRRNWAIVHVFHDSADAASPLHPDRPGNKPLDGFEPQTGEKVFRKSVNSAFIGTTLQEYLESNHHTSLVVIGLTTNHCISTSVRMAGNLGFHVIVVADATTTFPRLCCDWEDDCNKGKFDARIVHEVSLSSLHGEFATVMTTNKLLEMIQDIA